MITVHDLADATGMPLANAMLWRAPILACWPLASINTPLRQAMWLAECCHESRNFTALVESLNYTPEALKATFNRGKIRFTNEDALKYGRNGGKPADQVNIGRLAYGNRMGNDTGADGYNYRARGPLGITGKDNYRACGIFAGVGELYVQHPELLSTPEHGCNAAAWFWHVHKLNEYADKKDITGCSRVINCGPGAGPASVINGLNERIKFFKQILPVLTGRA